MYSLNKLESYSRISTLGPVGHRTSHFKRAVCISCRPCVDVHKGGKGGPAHVDACGQGEGGQKRDLFVDVINGWPLTTMQCQIQRINWPAEAIEYRPTDALVRNVSTGNLCTMLWYTKLEKLTFIYFKFVSSARTL